MAYHCHPDTGLPQNAAWYEWPVAYAYCSYEYNRPSTWARHAGQAAAGVYESAQYGKIPRLGQEVPVLTGAGSGPRTETELRTWTPEQQQARDLESWKAGQAGQREAIAVGEGKTYFPGGRLPFDADFNPTDSTIWWILGVAGVVVVVGTVVSR